MKLPKCRLCGHEHGLSEPHRFDIVYTPVKPQNLGTFPFNVKPGKDIVAANVMGDGIALTAAAHPIGPKTRRREPSKTSLETIEIKVPDKEPGGEQPRRAKASGRDPATVALLEKKTADEVGPSTIDQAQSVEPSRKDSIAALRKLLTKDLPAAEERELAALIAKLEARRETKKLSMQRYRKGLKGRKK